MAWVETQVEELDDNRVRLTVEVPSADVKHAIEHATSDLAEAAKVPGFRKGKVPPQVLLVRLGRDRVFTEAVESHIGGWFWNAAATTRIRPIEIEYAVPDGSTRKATATVKELKEKSLPPLDDELAVAASEFQTLDELRTDIETRLRDQLEEELETQFRASAVDELVDASKAE